MDIYISPPNAPYTEKTNEKSEVYTKEEVEKLLEEMLKKIKESEVQ